MGRTDHKPYSEVIGEIIVRDLIIEGRKHIKASSVVGYCHCDTHKGFLTKGLYKKHECAEKKCTFFEKFPDYPYWENFENVKKLKAKHKMAAKARKTLEEQLAEALSEMAREVQLLCHIFGYAILITRVQKNENGDYIINYVSDNLYNDWSLYFELAYSLKKKHKKNFWLKHVKLPNGEYASTDIWKKINGGITMDITPIYELKSRLRAAAVAGTSLLSEDFRLKKAAESFAPLAGSSPVFAKISEMTGKLLEDPSPENLLDTITLVDAVITTLGTVGVSGELEPIKITGNSAAVVNAPYSRLSPLLEALTTSGSGNYNTFLEFRDGYPELLNDYRVKPVLVKGLSASYSELAAEVGKTLSGMGKDVVPLLKKEFEPANKKKSVNIINIIEDICGAEENEFYLEQLDKIEKTENAEKEVRQAFIYALRHDERNVDKLIELAKTEKGKPKTAALAALAAFNCEKAAAFIEEYAKKKPIEVIKLMHNVSSKWSSELTARLIDELLVDDKGNKVTLSQAADEKKVKLKAKTEVYELHRALWGKWGESIEKIYREFDFNIPYEPLSTWLGYSIMLTRDESLMALAIELNNKSKLRGHYDFAETISRLLGTEDCTAWIKRKTHELNQKSAGNPHRLYTSDFAGVMEKVKFINGGYRLVITSTDEISKRDFDISAPIAQPMKELMDIYVYENHYVREFIKKPDMTVLSVIFKSGITNVKELADAYFGRSETFTPFAVRSFFGMLPGDRAFKLSEARRIVELSRSGKLKAKIDVDDLSVWVESGMK